MEGTRLRDVICRTFGHRLRFQGYAFHDRTMGLRYQCRCGLVDDRFIRYDSAFLTL